MDRSGESRMADSDRLLGRSANDYTLENYTENRGWRTSVDFYAALHKFIHFLKISSGSRVAAAIDS